jgi:hypothetical protein
MYSKGYHEIVHEDEFQAYLVDNPRIIMNLIKSSSNNGMMIFNELLNLYKEKIKFYSRN